MSTALQQSTCMRGHQDTTCVMSSQRGSRIGDGAQAGSTTRAGSVARCSARRPDGVPADRRLAVGHQRPGRTLARGQPCGPAGHRRTEHAAQPHARSRPVPDRDQSPPSTPPSTAPNPTTTAPNPTTTAPNPTTTARTPPTTSSAAASTGTSSTPATPPDASATADPRTPAAPDPVSMRAGLIVSGTVVGLADDPGEPATYLAVGAPLEDATASQRVRLRFQVAAGDGAPTEITPALEVRRGTGEFALVAVDSDGPGPFHLVHEWWHVPGTDLDTEPSPDRAPIAADELAHPHPGRFQAGPRRALDAGQPRCGRCPRCRCGHRDRVHRDRVHRPAARRRLRVPAH